MSNDTTTDRAALQRATSLVRPALADKAYVPALTHLVFEAGWVLAYDDKMAVSVRCEADLDCLVPGTLLVQGLASFGGKDILFQRDGQALVMKSGRSKVKLPTLPLDAHPFKWPADKGSEVDIEADMVKAVDRCLLSVGSDAAHPAQMGVTFDADEQGRAVFFSTDNATVSRAQCKSKAKLPGDAPVIMPKPFCEQLVALSRAFPDTVPYMILRTGSIEVVWGTTNEDKDFTPVCRLFSRVPVDLEPMDFPRIVAKHCGDVDKLKKKLGVVPDEFDSSLDRALLVLAGEVKKKATVKVDDGTLKLRASTDLGDSDDTMKADLDDVGPVTVDAALVARGLKAASRIGITDVVTILAGGEDCEFLHMVAHIREVK